MCMCVNPALFKEGRKEFNDEFIEELPAGRYSLVGVLVGDKSTVYMEAA